MDALRSGDDDRDWVYEYLVKGKNMHWQPLPDKFTLEQYINPARDQFHGSTCGAFTGAAMLETLSSGSTAESTMEPHGFTSCADETGAAADTAATPPSERTRYLSPEFIYFHRANKPQNGMYGRDVFNVLRKIGTVPEEIYPYTLGNPVVPPDEHVYKLAKQYRIGNYARVKSIMGVKRALVEAGPCYFGLPLYNHTERFWDKSYGYRMETGHSVMVYGYDTEGFMFVNSWGAEWGDNGRGKFPYSDFDSVWEVWVAVNS